MYRKILVLIPYLLTFYYILLLVLNIENVLSRTSRSKYVASAKIYELLLFLKDICVSTVDVAKRALGVNAFTLDKQALLICLLYEEEIKDIIDV